MLKIVFLLLASGGLPVAIAMAGAAALYALVSGDVPPFAVVERLVGSVATFPVAVPLFMLTGQLMNNAGTLARVHDLALTLVGWCSTGSSALLRCCR